MSKFTVKEIKSMLDERNVKYTSKMAKEDLLKMLDEYEKTKSILIPQVHIRVEQSEALLEEEVEKEASQASQASQAPKKSRRQRKVEDTTVDTPEVIHEVTHEEVPNEAELRRSKTKKSTLWVETLKEYNKDKKYKIHNKEIIEYKEILELYNKKKASSQL